MPQHLQMTRITLKGLATMEAVPCKLPLIQRSSYSHLLSLGFTIFSSGKPRTAWMLFNASAFLGSNKTTSKRWSWFQKTSLYPSLMQLPELKRAVNCDKKSGCRLHEQRRIDLWTPLILSANVAAPSYPWPINFLGSSCFCCKKDCKASAIGPASVELIWSTTKKCSSGFSLANICHRWIALPDYRFPASHLLRWKSRDSLWDYT